MNEPPASEHATFATPGRWLVAALMFALMAGWAFLAGRTIMDSGDRMIGFHPAILGLIPGITSAIGGAILLAAFRQREIAAGLACGGLLLLLVLFKGHRLETHAWRKSVERHAVTNEAAMASIRTHLSEDDFASLWDHEKLSPIIGFQWHAEHHISAPGDLYYGFNIAGVPHVRIQKVRHGWRGIALMPAGAEPPIGASRLGLEYSRVGSSNWFIWTM